MKKSIYKIAAAVSAILLTAPFFSIPEKAKADDDTIVLRVCNWEEYIDEGGWEEDEAIELEEETIFGDNDLVTDFEEWYYETYGKKVEVEYSCFGTNEELYSQLTLGDTFDLVCPSDYMIMKMMAEDMLEPLSDDFFDESDENNYYIKGVAPFIKETFDSNTIDGEAWSQYAACYMWGITGFVYNPEKIPEKDVSTWTLLTNKNYYRKITIKDNVRDALFPTIGAMKSDLLTSEEFLNSPNYKTNLAIEMNDTSVETLEEAESYLKAIRNNVYSFETDSGKADMVSGKIVANLQWSGDAVYTMDQAEEDDVYLNWAVPEECTDLWFDGYVMLKSGINGDAEKKQAAEAFINFLSMPESAIRNMYYIGYSSSITGGESPLIYEYLDWQYGADEETDEEIVEYPVGYYFSGDAEDENYILTVPESQTKRQLSAAYPPADILARSAVMEYFDTETNARANQMWINIRCFNLSQITADQWKNAGMVVGIIVVAAVLIIIVKKKVYR